MLLCSSTFLHYLNFFFFCSLSLSLFGFWIFFFLLFYFFPRFSPLLLVSLSFYLPLPFLLNLSKSSASLYLLTFFHPFFLSTHLQKISLLLYSTFSFFSPPPLSLRGLSRQPFVKITVTASGETARCKCRECITKKRVDI